MESFPELYTEKMSITTPAFIYDSDALRHRCRGVVDAFQHCGLPLFALKSSHSQDVLHLISSFVEGFAASSLFEARLARSVIGHKGTVHITTPGFRPDEIDEIAELCDYMAFNSLSQWERFGARVQSKAKCGLRINPQFSVVGDNRYDPCRKHSKLGVPLDQLEILLHRSPESLNGITGIHFHTNCDSPDCAALLATVQKIDRHLAPLLSRIEWVNMGGGYLFDETADQSELREAVELLRSKYDVEVYIEPGAAFVREAGTLIASVLDLFPSDGKMVAVLDTTVNHMPEVFEYQFEPDVLGHVEEGRHRYILAGCTCLAGDLFGEYAFDEPLEIGSRVVFQNVGAYTLVKAHMFNGVNLPTIYSLTQNGEMKIMKQFSYEDFAYRNGVETDVLT